MRELGGRIVLMDFSGAQALTSEHDAEVFSGTLACMSPELLGCRRHRRVRCLQPWGAAVFLLTGTVPVEGSSIAALRSAHGRGARKRLRDLRSDVPQAIVQVIASARQSPIRRSDIRRSEISSTRWLPRRGPRSCWRRASPFSRAPAARPPAAHSQRHTGRAMLWAAAAGVLLARRPRRGRHALPSVGGSRHRALYRRAVLHHRKLAAPVARWAADRVQDRRPGPQPALDQAARSAGRPAAR